MLRVSGSDDTENIGAVVPRKLPNIVSIGLKLRKLNLTEQNIRPDGGNGSGKIKATNVPTERTSKLPVDPEVNEIEYIPAPDDYTDKYEDILSVSQYGTSILPYDDDKATGEILSRVLCNTIDWQSSDDDTDEEGFSYVAALHPDSTDNVSEYECELLEDNSDFEPCSLPSIDVNFLDFNVFHDNS